MKKIKNRLLLFYSGEKFGSHELTELARWGHFFGGEQPWEKIQVM